MNERLNPLRGMTEKVAMTGSYNDLKDKPAIPTALADLTDGVWKPGDVLTINSQLPFNGFISSGATSIYFTLPLGKPVQPGTAMKVTALSVHLRGISGYIENGPVDVIANKAFSVTTTIPSYDAGYAFVVITKSSAYTNSTNNTPISVNVTKATLQFTEATGDEPMPGPEMFD